MRACVRALRACASRATINPSADAKRTLSFRSSRPARRRMLVATRKGAGRGVLATPPRARGRGEGSLAVLSSPLRSVVRPRVAGPDRVREAPPGCWARPFVAREDESVPFRVSNWEVHFSDRIPIAENQTTINNQTTTTTTTTTRRQPDCFSTTKL